MANRFGLLKTRLGDELSKADCQRLCAYFECPRARQDAILTNSLPSLELLEYLEESGRIDGSNLTGLLTAFATLGMSKAAQEVREHELNDKSQEVGSDREGIPKDYDSEEEATSQPKGEERDKTFREFLEHIGLAKCFPVNHMRLDTLVKIKDPSIATDRGSLFENFWQKLSSLDYRVRSCNFFKQAVVDVPKYSLGDFIFAVIHCSDEFLRQDILSKMSACHLAVPIVLQSVDHKGNPEFLTWSLRRIVKKWKGSNSLALEQHVIRVPMFTVSFLRMGDIEGVSKSSILNNLLGPYQGNDAHSFFLTRESDFAFSTFSKGCVEAVWYLPMNTNDLEKFKWVSAFLNLRGDCNHFPAQTKFICKASDLTIVLLAERNCDEFLDTVKSIKADSKRYFFVIIKDDQATVPATRSNMKRRGEYLYVRSRNIDGVDDFLCNEIMEAHMKCDEKSFQSLEQIGTHYGDIVPVEDSGKDFTEAKRLVKEIIDVDQVIDLSCFKFDAFPLQGRWVDWVEIDKERLKPDSEKEESVEHSRENILQRKDEKRTEQLHCGLSNTMKCFGNALKKIKSHPKLFEYFLAYLHDVLFQVVDLATRTHLEQIEQYEDDISRLDKLIGPKSSTPSGTLAESEARGKNRIEAQYKDERVALKRLRCEEIEKCKQKVIGWEHFIRELGQWHEAHTELKEKRDAEVASLPVIAAKLLADGHALEIMDGDTGRVPLSWVTSVLCKLAQNLEDPSVLVLSVIGVQSSGKSTLLNSMFGVRFPVRAGRCTRGLFMRLIKLENTYAEQLRIKYVILVDSEGVCSLERSAKEEYKFDNELVTLALCISDVTIINIEGENIGPEMTSLLGMAAHAFIRMKEVDLHAQCRIVQQRVADLTASERNKINMDQIVDTLDDATLRAAKEEGFEGRYQQFSDIFDLRLNKDLQYIPCLWTGPMSPPSQFYSDVVSKIKMDILSDIESKRIVPQLSVSTFTQRIHDVWSAVKDENFLFKFHNNVAAIDSNNLCMELNRLIADMRAGMVKELPKWQMRLRQLDLSPEDEFESIRQECRVKLNSQKKNMNSSLESFVAQHERGTTLLADLGRFKQANDTTISAIESEMISMLQNDLTTLKLKNHKLLAQMKTKLRERVKESALAFKNTQKDPSYRGTSDPEKYFSDRWEEWVNHLKGEFPLTKVSEKALEATCENLLFSVVAVKFISPEIYKLMKEEGGITKHADQVDWPSYFPQKGEKDLNNEEWFSKNGRTLQTVIESSYQQMEDNISSESFDANLFQLVLQSALQSISSNTIGFDIPYLLKAKIVLHICSKAYDVALRNQRMYEERVSFESFFEKERSVLRGYFLSFVLNGDQTEKVVEFIKPYLVEGAYIQLKHDIEKIIITELDRTIESEEQLHRSILVWLGLLNNFEVYMKYVYANITLKAKFLCEFASNANPKTWPKMISLLEAGTTAAVEEILVRIEGIFEVTRVAEEEKDPQKPREWIDSLSEVLDEWTANRFSGAGIELSSYHICDFDGVAGNLEQFLSQGEWKSRVFDKLQLPQQIDEETTALFLKRMSQPPISSFLKESCNEQCPVCKAYCENSCPLGPEHEHFTCVHLPRGVSGSKDPNTSRLLIENCTLSIETGNRSYTTDSGEKKHFNLRNLKRDFPTWSFKPRSMGTSNSAYWKWFMANFNERLAEFYDCKAAKIPSRWKRISQDEAMSSLDSVGLIHESTK